MQYRTVLGTVRGRQQGPLRRRVVLTIYAGVLLASCGTGSDTLAADAPHFAGLDPSIVAEVVASPVVREKIDEEGDETKESLAQGIARNFAVCRDAHRVYETWIQTGVVPSLNPLPMPANPAEPSASWWITDYAWLEAQVESGEPDKLRLWLTGEGTCGEWIPATPGDASGPTIKDITETKS